MAFYHFFCYREDLLPPEFEHFLTQLITKNLYEKKQYLVTPHFGSVTLRDLSTDPTSTTSQETRRHATKTVQTLPGRKN